MTLWDGPQDGAVLGDLTVTVTVGWVGPGTGARVPQSMFKQGPGWQGLDLSAHMAGEGGTFSLVLALLHPTNRRDTTAAKNNFFNFSLPFGGRC
jgi:hypothetical protein